MALEILDWIEKHKTAVDIIKWGILLLIAWITGVFKFIYKYTRKPTAKIVPTASLVFYEHYDTDDKHELTNADRCSFIIHVSITNLSKEIAYIDQFELSFNSNIYKKNYKQKLLRMPFPNRPIKKIGTHVKLLSVFFSEYPLEEHKMPKVTGVLNPNEIQSGYLLFISFTHGTWNPKIINNKIKVKLETYFSDGTKITDYAKIRITSDAKIIEDFTPGLVEYVKVDNTWNQSIDLVDKL